MANYSYTNNGINFTLQDNDILQFKKLSNADGEFSRGVVVPLINAVEIDWNGAKPGIGEGTNGITTTSELVKEVYSPMFAKAA
ncbi:MAG: hypothetical protein J6W03_01920 [Bacteroidaceae bacterium]|nr:hypothetical protein [Bacteroidaceae bacterium]